MIKLLRNCLSAPAVLLFAGCSVFQPQLESELPAAAVPLEAQPQAEPLNRNYFLLDSPEQSVIGEPQIVFTDKENTFSDLAREYGLGYDELMAANPGIDPWLPGDRTPVLLPTQYVLPPESREGLVLNIASRRLFYFPAVEEGQPVSVMTFPIGIGRVGWETPVGETEVVSKARDPHWYVPASVRKEHAEAGDPLPAVVPPGPDNPLGHFVLKLDMPGYLIHGTNQPIGVGMRVSHGCIRLYPENIELLYELVDNGTQVSIVNAPYLAGWKDGELYFESHTPLEDDGVTPEEHLSRIFESGEDDSDAFVGEHEQLQARAVASEALGVPVRVQFDDVDEIYERARLVRNTVEPDPHAPTLAEVRAILDAPTEEPETADVVTPPTEGAEDE